MVDFDPTAHRAAVDAVHRGLRELTGRIEAFSRTAAVAAAAPGVPAPLAAAILDVGATVTAAASEFGDTVAELLRGAAAPAYLFADALGWTEVRARASAVQGVLRVDQLPVRDHWKGAAADRYALAVASQSGAAGRVAAVAGAAATTLTTCAVAGLAFYVAIGLILARLIAALVAAMIAIGSGAFSWAGFLLACEEVGLSALSVGVAVTALSALVGAQAVSLAALLGELGDDGLFPGGHWPRAVTSSYSDATVTDGDAEWSWSR